MKHRSLGSGCASPEGHVSNLSVVVLSPLVALETASPASAETVFTGLGDLPERG